MPPQNYRIIIRIDPRGTQLSQILHYEWITADNCDQMIRRHFPQLAGFLHPRLPRFTVPVHVPPGTRRYEPVVSLGAINIDRLFAILRVLGWSGNLYWGVRDGETVPDWHWSTRVVPHPHGLPPT